MKKEQTIGEFNYCPNCARPVKESDFLPRTDLQELEYWVCTCCDREWEACPCSPAYNKESKCLAEKE